MKIKRFTAPDMRTAIAAVRREIGEDAVILSNKSTDDGVELIAAIDFDEEQFHAEAKKQIASNASRASQRHKNQAGRVNQGRQANPTRQASKPMAPPPASRQHEAARPVSRPAGLDNEDYQMDRNRHAQPAARHQASGYQPLAEDLFDSADGERQDDAIEAVRREMLALRRMMETELSGISWREMGDQQYESRELFRQLINMGLSAEIAEQLMRAAADAGDFEQQWQKAMYYLSTEILVTGEDITETGGIVAVVGPTGVGKTTSIAKLAARYCLRHGNRQVALVSTDNYRIGAREQLHTYGRILNVPVRTAATANELMDILDVFADKRFILIDTAGMSHQDTELSEQLSMLEAAGRRVNRFLALSATTELAALKRALQSFAPIRPDACLVTKTDEAAALGGILSVVINSGLPLAYYTDGQKVPEDMHLARAHPLVQLASSLARDSDDNFGDAYLAFALSEARAQAYQ